MTSDWLEAKEMNLIDNGSESVVQINGLYADKSEKMKSWPDGVIDSMNFDGISLLIGLMISSLSSISPFFFRRTTTWLLSHAPMTNS